MKRCLSFLLTLAAACVLFFSMPLDADAATMTSSNAFIEILKQREGFAKYPYEDNSQWSIGYGTRVPDGMLEYYQKNGISEEEAEKLMLQMLAGFENSVLKFAEKNNLTLTQNQFDALVSFSYNCGDAWTRETNGNMNRAVREGWTGSDFVYAICLWSGSAGKYILINRRMYEANMYLNGIYEKNYNYDTGTFRYVFLDAGQGKTEYVIHGYDTNDPKPVRYKFKTIPTGKDANGNTFTYEFAGWYTAPENGKYIEVLDDSLACASQIYAMWKDQAGNLVYLPKGEACDVTVSVTNVEKSVNVRSGPGTQYSKIGELKKNATVKLVRVYDNGGDLWGEYEGGWISLEYTNYDEVIAELEVWPKSGVINGNNVNVRSGPGTTNPKQYSLNEGDPVTIHEKTRVGSMYWGRLDDGNWISLDYVTFDETLPDTKPDPAPEPGDWISEGGKWYYYIDNVAQTGWELVSGKWYYFDSSGIMQVGWLKSDGVWYYLRSSGAMATGWCKVGNTYYYFNTSGVMQTGWQLIGGQWYYLQPSGAMFTGWMKSGNTYYYLQPSGAMAIGWCKVGNVYYYFNSSGLMQTGWLKNGNTWYYLQSSGAMQTGWLKLGNTWYYLQSSGAMQTGWLKLGNTWYYLQSSGAMQTGWLKLGDTWYYFHSSGAMATGSVKIGTKIYRFKANGAWIR